MQKETVDYTQYLDTIFKNKGKLKEGYSTFHNYSVNNQLLVVYQLISRDMQIRPIATFNKWKELGRSVKKGEKALKMLVPYFVKKEEENEETFLRGFSVKNLWFTLEQTQGEDLEEKQVTKAPKIDINAIMKHFGITEIPFNHVDGNMQGYAIPKDKKIAINPLATNKKMTLYHEVGHVVMGHAETDLTRPQKEFEAEFFCYMLLEYESEQELQEYCKGYIQSWVDKHEVKSSSIMKVLAKVDEVLKIKGDV